MRDKWRRFVPGMWMVVFAEDCGVEGRGGTRHPSWGIVCFLLVCTSASLKLCTHGLLAPVPICIIFFLCRQIIESSPVSARDGYQLYFSLSSIPVLLVSGFFVVLLNDFMPWGIGSGISHFGK